jgi:hypothetical protein
MRGMKGVMGAKYLAVLRLVRLPRSRERHGGAMSWPSLRLTLFLRKSPSDASLYRFRGGKRKLYLLSWPIEPI